ncbi:hypothetical protein [Streptomyces sp. NPDC001415]
MDIDRLADEHSVVDDVDRLIEQLETRFEDSELLTAPTMASTEGCTKGATCTGSCPCGPG